MLVEVSLYLTPTMHEHQVMKRDILKSHQITIFYKKLLSDNCIHAPDPVLPSSTVIQWLSDNAEVGNNTSTDNSWIRLQGTLS